MGGPYFAYASNMDTAQMAQRCPGARVVDGAILPGMRFVITSDGYANVIPDNGRSVFGLLWNLTADDERALDQYEGVRPGLYRKQERDVTTIGGRSVRALIYLASATDLGSAVPGYLELVVAAARAHQLPQAYVAELEEWHATH